VDWHPEDPEQELHIAGNIIMASYWNAPSILVLCWVFVYPLFVGLPEREQVHFCPDVLYDDYLNVSLLLSTWSLLRHLSSRLKMGKCRILLTDKASEQRFILFLTAHCPDNGVHFISLTEL